MQEVTPVNPPSGPLNEPTSSATTSSEVADQFELSFESLLEIILTQLTYQDPLDPLDNFEFVSQLAQFTQIQLTQDMSDNIELLVSAQSTDQATLLLGREIDVAAGSTALSGTVTAISFEEGTPLITIETSEGQTISGLPLGNVTQIRENE